MFVNEHHTFELPCEISAFGETHMAHYTILRIASYGIIIHENIISVLYQKNMKNLLRIAEGFMNFFHAFFMAKKT